MTECAEVVACRCSNYHKKTDTVQKSAEKQKKKKATAYRQIRSDVQYPATTVERTQEAEDTPDKKIEKLLLFVCTKPVPVETLKNDILQPRFLVNNFLRTTSEM